MTRPFLKYPGGKQLARKKLLPLFPADITEVCSPFFGGGSVEFSLYDKGIKVYGYDIFEKLIDFYDVAFEDHKPIFRQAMKIYNNIFHLPTDRIKKIVMSYVKFEFRKFNAMTKESRAAWSYGMSNKEGKELIIMPRQKKSFTLTCF